MKKLLATFCISLLAGCAAETGQPPGETADRADPAMQGPAFDEHGNPYTITEVTVAADGRQTVAVYSRAKTPGVATAVPGLNAKDYNASEAPCSDATVHVFDKTLSDCSSQGCNEMCFTMTDPTPARYETGGIDFGSHCVTTACTSTWNSKVKSYWSGNMYSGLKRDYASDPNWKCDEWFSGSWVWGNAGTCGQNANKLVIMSQ